MGGAGFGALAPDNDGSQEKADESADEKSDNEGNHLSILFLDILTQADFEGQKIEPPFLAKRSFYHIRLGSQSANPG
jgi:hypothetical protein